jgi:hypothetical protein
MLELPENLKKSMVFLLPKITTPVAQTTVKSVVEQRQKQVIAI